VSFVSAGPATVDVLGPGHLGDVGNEIGATPAAIGWGSTDNMDGGAVGFEHPALRTLVAGTAAVSMGPRLGAARTTADERTKQGR
jgi:hypothetical protein